MALQAIYWRKYGPRRHGIRVVDDKGTMEKRFVVPNPLPDGYSTNAQWLKDQVRKMIRVIRRRWAVAQAKAAEEDQWDSYTDEDSSTILSELQTEFGD